MKRILVADDDAHIREVIGFALQQADYETIFAQDGAEALALVAQKSPDLVVLDIGMPERDGLDVCANLRRDSEIPIIFLSARAEEIDRIVGLEIGGDDYVVKPFSPRELVARVGRVLKRSSPPKIQSVDESSHGVLRIDREAHRVMFDGVVVDATVIEFSILSLLMRRPAMVLSRDQIMQGAWPTNVHVSDRTIDSHIRNLRAKLAAAGCTDAIVTVHGTGFRLGDCAGAA